MLEVVEHQQYLLISQVFEKLGLRLFRGPKTQTDSLGDARSHQFVSIHRGQGYVANAIIKGPHLFVRGL